MSSRLRIFVAVLFAIFITAFLLFVFGVSPVFGQGGDTPTPTDFPTETPLPTITPSPTPFTMAASVDVAATTITSQSFVLMLSVLVALAIARIIWLRVWTKI